MIAINQKIFLWRVKVSLHNLKRIVFLLHVVHVLISIMFCRIPAKFLITGIAVLSFFSL